MSNTDAIELQLKRDFTSRPVILQQSTKTKVSPLKIACFADTRYNANPIARELARPFTATELRGSNTDTGAQVPLN